MMTSRVLPQDEWPRLDGTEAETLWPTLNPENTQVLVVEEDGRIVATWTMLRVVHAECIWVATSHRGSFGVAKRLFRGLREIAKGWGVNRVITGSVSPDVTDLILRFGGVPMPCETWILPVNGPLLSKNRGSAQMTALGHYFHDQITALAPGAEHPEDPEHDDRVGRALWTAVKQQNPDKAMQEYNVWAKSAGYEPVEYLGTVGGKMRADIKTAVIDVDENFTVSLVTSCQ